MFEDSAKSLTFKNVASRWKGRSKAYKMPTIELTYKKELNFYDEESGDRVRIGSRYSSTTVSGTEYLNIGMAFQFQSYDSDENNSTTQVR